CYRRFEKSETLLLLFAHKAHRPPQLLTETESCRAEPQAGSVVIWTTNTPRLPAPFLAVTEITLEPFPSILCNDNPRTMLLPFPTCAALMVRTPVALVIENVAVPVFLDESL